MPKQRNRALQKSVSDTKKGVTATSPIAKRNTVNVTKMEFNALSSASVPNARMSLERQGRWSRTEQLT